MSKPYNSVEEVRNAVPIARFINSSSPDGALLVLNIFIKPEKLDDYVQIVKPVVHKARELPECEFCEISVNPEDKGHIRIIHCYSKDSAWIKEVGSLFFRKLALAPVANLVDIERGGHVVVWRVY